MPASTYAANAIINHFLRGTALTAPTQTFLSLHTADPGGTGSNEVTVANWPAYQRQTTLQGGTIAESFVAAASKESSNTKSILFPAHDGTADVTVTHFGIWTAQTGGNLLFYGSLTASKTLQPTDECIVHPSNLEVSIT